MSDRRVFLRSSLLSGLALLVNKRTADAAPFNGVKGKPIVVATWEPNTKANAEAWNILGSGGKAVDAVEAGLQIPEAYSAD